GALGVAHVALDEAAVGPADLGQRLAGREVDDLIDIEALVRLAPAGYRDVKHDDGPQDDCVFFTARSRADQSHQTATTASPSSAPPSASSTFSGSRWTRTRPPQFSVSATSASFLAEALSGARMYSVSAFQMSSARSRSLIKPRAGNFPGLGRQKRSSMTADYNSRCRRREATIRSPSKALNRVRRISSSWISCTLASARGVRNSTFMPPPRSLIAFQSGRVAASLTLIHAHGGRRREAAERLDAADAVPRVLLAGRLALALVALHEARHEHLLRQRRQH